jgi:hypothetical protein
MALLGSGVLARERKVMSRTVTATLTLSCRRAGGGGGTHDCVSFRAVSTVDYHTGGEPFRIVAAPPVELPGSSVAEDRGHLTLLGGQLTYFLARLSFHMGDHAAARKHAVLAWRHAEDVGQPVLCGSVKALQSSIAFYAGQYQKALDLLQAAEPYVVPYTHARLAALCNAGACHTR